MGKRTLNKLFIFDMTGKTVDQTADLEVAVAAMTRTGKNCLLVKRGEGKPVGVISEHDVVVAFARLGAEASKAKVSDYMTIDVIAVREDNTLNEALKLMAQHNIRHMPVLSQSGEVLDFLSMMDLVTKQMMP